METEEENPLPKDISGMKFLTIYDELAEMGELDYFIEEYMSERFETDMEFQKEAYNSMFANAQDAVQLAEVFVLRKLSESLDFFIEHTKSWLH